MSRRSRPRAPDMLGLPRSPRMGGSFRRNHLDTCRAGRGRLEWGNSREPTMITRLLLSGMLATVGPAVALAETPCKLTEANVGVMQVPEAFREDFLRKLEADCEIGKLQPV